MDQSIDHYPWTLIRMARHGIPTSYLYLTFVSQYLVGIFDWNGTTWCSSLMLASFFYFSTPYWYLSLE
jgi:hypothetical protein